MSTLCCWQRETGVDEEGLEELFELARDDGQAALCFLNDGSEDGDAGLARDSAR